MFNWLKTKLSLQQTAGLNIDDPSLTGKRRDVIKNKAFLNRLYKEWYSSLAAIIPPGPEIVIELGAGGGFLKNMVPEVVTTEVFNCPDVDIVLDACDTWPFGKGQLKAVLMVDVLHHLPDVRRFFRNAEKAVRTNGTIAMIEPWVTPWSRLIYSRLHHEPFLPLNREWEFQSSGPLSGANSALPWILFARDRHIFEQEFPVWKIEIIKAQMPFSYLLSGGVSLHSLLPGKLYRLVRLMEQLSGLDRRMAMFALIILRRI